MSTASGYGFSAAVSNARKLKPPTKSLVGGSQAEQQSWGDPNPPPVPKPPRAPKSKRPSIGRMAQERMDWELRQRGPRGRGQLPGNNEPILRRDLIR